MGSPSFLSPRSLEVPPRASDHGRAAAQSMPPPQHRQESPQLQSQQSSEVARSQGSAATAKKPHRNITAFVIAGVFFFRQAQPKKSDSVGKKRGVHLNLECLIHKNR